MKTSTRLIIAAVTITGGCLLLLCGLSGGGALLALSTLFSMPRSELSRPVPPRELWVSFAVLVLLVAFIVAAKYVVPPSASDAIERIIRHPAIIVPLWLFMLWALFRSLQRHKGEVDA